MSNRAVFIDRDGTVNVEIATYVRSPEELVVFPHAAEALKPLIHHNIPIIIVSNQAGIAKGLMTNDDLLAIEDKLRQTLLAGGIMLTGAYYCRHTDEANCACRKPKGGLLKMAAQEHMIGDSWRDMAAGRDAGVQTVFVPTGINPEEQRRRMGNMADYQSANLSDAVRWICGRLENEI